MLRQKWSGFSHPRGTERPAPLFARDPNLHFVSHHQVIPYETKGRHKLNFLGKIPEENLNEGKQRHPGADLIAVGGAVACQSFGISQTTPLLSDENEQIADLLVGLTVARKTWGFEAVFFASAQREGAPVDTVTRR
jgi:hypothetical protein